jgi:Na+-driven multidrug efflux pump
VLLGIFFSADMLLLLGAKGPIIKPQLNSFTPHYCFRSFPGTSHDGKQYICAEGKAKFAMVAMIIPAIVNIILDIIFIKVMD